MYKLLVLWYAQRKRKGGIAVRLLLQNRWKQNGNRLFYYGLRHEPYTFQTSVRLSKKELPLIKKAVCGASFTEKESQAARRLIRLGALVLPEAYKKKLLLS